VTPGACARRGVLVVFAKAPRPGLVKTRMTPPLSPEQAAELYACMLDDVLRASARFCAELDLDAWVAVHPAEACAEIAARAPAGFRAVAQRGAGLGPRMEWAVREAAAAGASPILLRGSDSPALGRELLEAALAALARADLVLSPDRDGGYQLVGLRAPAPGLFAHPMSTSRVLEDTLARARARRLRAQLLEAGFDLDRPADLRRLAGARSPSVTDLCRSTLAWLDQQGPWSPLGPQRGVG
jgi:rSAM/selenodomain-associated transferase 1